MQASAVVAHGLSCSEACVIFPTRDRTHAPLCWECGVLAAGPPAKSSLKDSYDYTGLT